MPQKKVTPKNLRAVLARLSDIADMDKSFAKLMAAELNTLLNDLGDDDHFGTERQLDPRGDHRD